MPHAQHPSLLAIADRDNVDVGDLRQGLEEIERLFATHNRWVEGEGKAASPRPATLQRLPLLSALFVAALLVPADLFSGWKFEALPSAVFSQQRRRRSVGFFGPSCLASRGGLGTGGRGGGGSSILGAKILRAIKKKERKKERNDLLRLFAIWSTLQAGLSEPRHLLLFLQLVKLWLRCHQRPLVLCFDLI